MVEAWVWETPWAEVKDMCNIDDGDTARLLCRVADVLRQISQADAVAAPLRATANAAYSRIYRQPICDLLSL